MGKIIIDAKFLGINFMNVIKREVDSLSTELGLDKNIIDDELSNAKTQEAFMESIQKYFGDNLKINL